MEHLITYLSEAWPELSLLFFFVAVLAIANVWERIWRERND